ncbi:MAG: CoA-binding protein [Deltaproteobacteria bacterium]|nr:CoA-binding protein [Deltaproteobacteria bacterium]MBW1959925.1 CoA-binding protein [Deltaproteobacteria bacterium]MBW1993699.1 CoA-binding protein [Deltaproteobacteria bacterium]MBW2150154.1 CoA-binding protein [Deltaproteobacteria bacterium]
MNFQPIFKPKTMAVVGVSLSNDRHPANVIFNKAHLRSPVKVFAVNPKGGVLQGETVYPSIAQIPQQIDLAVIAVRAEYAPAVVEDCIKHGVGGAAVISGGFAEVGRGDLQDRMVEYARKADFPFIGPNCLGLYSPPRVDTFFLPSERMVRPESGNVALVSQSGGVLVDQMVKFANEGIGLSKAVSIGNKALVNELHLLDYFTRDKQTKVIAFYLEGFGENEGRKFVLAASRCSKPVIVLKAGKTPDGSRAVSSHTASIAGDYEVFSSVMTQYGLVEAKNEFELLSFCESLSYYNRSISGSIGIISPSGGHGALAVDACTAHGLMVRQLSDRVQQRIKKNLSRSVRDIASTENPIDLTGSAVDHDFVAAAEGLSRAREIDCVIVLMLPYSPGISSDLGARISQIFRGTGKPVVAYVPHLEKYRMLIEGFEFNRIPVSSSIEGAVLMVEALKRSRPC